MKSSLKNFLVTEIFICNCSLIFRYNDTILSDKDCENVYELVYSSNRQVAQAAGEFLNTKLFLRDYEGPKTLKIHKGKKQSLNAPLIRDLVQFFIESEVILQFNSLYRTI